MASHLNLVVYTFTDMRGNSKAIVVYSLMLIFPNTPIRVYNYFALFFLDISTSLDKFSCFPTSRARIRAVDIIPYRSVGCFLFVSPRVIISKHLYLKNTDKPQDGLK